MKKKKSKIGELFKKMKGTSNLEVKFAKLLDEINIQHIKYFNYKNKEFDFLLTDFNILIETHGCFFHCCKTHHPVPKYKFQRNSIKNDKSKSKLIKFDKDYNLLVIWEHEMNDTKKLKTKLFQQIDKLNKKGLEN